MATDLPGLTRLHVAPEANPDDLMCLPVRTVRQLTEAARVLEDAEDGMRAVADWWDNLNPDELMASEDIGGWAVLMGLKADMARTALAPFRGGA